MQKRVYPWLWLRVRWLFYESLQIIFEDIFFLCNGKEGEDSTTTIIDNADQ